MPGAERQPPVRLSKRTLKAPQVFRSLSRTAVQAAVGQADILITTTRGKGPLIEADWIPPGTHIIAIGTDQRGKQEFDPQILVGQK